MDGRELYALELLDFEFQMALWDREERLLRRLRPWWKRRAA